MRRLMFESEKIVEVVVVVDPSGVEVEVGARVEAEAEADPGERGATPEIRLLTPQFEDPLVVLEVGPDQSQEEKAHLQTGRVQPLQLNRNLGLGPRMRIILRTLEAVFSNESQKELVLDIP